MRLVPLAWLLASLACAASKPLVVRAARMFDGKSARIAAPGLVVVENGRISAAGPLATLPAAYDTIDLGDATLLPGFIDAHTTCR